MTRRKDDVRIKHTTREQERVASYMSNRDKIPYQEALLEVSSMIPPAFAKLQKEAETNLKYLSKREIKLLLRDLLKMVQRSGLIAEMTCINGGVPNVVVEDGGTTISVVYFASTRTYRVYIDQVPYTTVARADEVLETIDEIIGRVGE